jgi:hypothetical protein
MVERVKRIPLGGIYALLAYMPFHVFLAQSLSVITGGLSVWKIAKDIFGAFLLLFIVVRVYQGRKATPLFKRFLLLLVLYGAIHLIVWALNPHIYKQGALLGIIYNNRVPGYLVMGMGAALLLPKEFKAERLVRFVILISTIVCALGVLQYFLPKDLLTHFGYSLARGVKPAFFIDDKPDLPRIMSTLRDPNSLGAFLILPITILVYEFFRNNRRRMLITGLLLLHGLALFLTFSRSAWAAALISAGIIVASEYRRQLKPLLLKYWPIALGTVLLAGSLLLTARHQYVVQNIIEHSDKSTRQVGSNGLHVIKIEQGIKGIIQKPIGHGPGTAGLVSIHNPGGGLLTENYYLQIGYEAGILGLLLFVAINILVYLRLLRSRNSLAPVILASFWGYVLMNMLLQIWSNEAVALQWWLLAGIVLALPPQLPNKKRA